MPKSSIAIRTPNARSRCRCSVQRRRCADEVTSVLSVISMISASPGSPALGQRGRTVSAKPGSSSCRPETLTGHRDLVVAVPPPGVLAGGPQHPGADGHDEAGVLGDRDEVEPAAPGRAAGLPPQQRLHRGDPAGVEVHDRLVVQDELVVGQRLAQAGADAGCGRRRAAAQLGLEQRDPVLAGLLRRVQGQVGVAQHVRRGRAAAGRGRWSARRCWW